MAAEHPCFREVNQKLKAENTRLERLQAPASFTPRLDGRVLARFEDAFYKLVPGETEIEKLSTDFRYRDSFVAIVSTVHSMPV